MRISESQLDNLVHNLSSNLSSYGVSLDSDLMTDLNDLLSGFLTDKCDVEISQADEPENIIQISFDIVSGGVDQQVRIIDSEYDEYSIVEGLLSGELATTTWFEKGGAQTIDIVATGKAIAEIVSQEINGEYDDFR